jgi:integrase
VFPSSKAEKPWRPDSISREFREVRDSLNLSETLTMRNLRHYCVTVLAAGGVDVVTAARRMGHSPNVMLDVYAHVLDEADREAAGVLAANLEKVRKG